MVPHQSSQSLLLIDRLLREQPEADYQRMLQVSGQATVTSVCDRLMRDWTQKLILCTNDEERLFVQALVYSTDQFKKFVLGELSTRYENNKVELENGGY